MAVINLLTAGTRLHAMANNGIDHTRFGLDSHQAARATLSRVS